MKTKRGERHMNQIRYERRTYTNGYTPIQKLERLSKALGGPSIWIKRDDRRWKQNA